MLFLRFVYFEYFGTYSRMVFLDIYYIFKTRKTENEKSVSSFWALRHRYSTPLYMMYERWHVQLHVLNLVCTLITPDLVLHFIKKFRNKFRAFATRGLGVTKKHKSLCMTFIKDGLLPLSIYRAHLSNYMGRSLKFALCSRLYVWPALLAAGHTYGRLLDCSIHASSRRAYHLAWLANTRALLLPWWQPRRA